jgi:hypothetical protein
MKKLLMILLLTAGCATGPENGWDNYPTESVTAVRCVEKATGVSQEFTEVKVHSVPDGTCSGHQSFTDRHLMLEPMEASPEKGCYLMGDKVNIYLEEDAEWDEVSKIVSHEMVHLMLDKNGVPADKHHEVTEACGLD